MSASHGSLAIDRAGLDALFAALERRGYRGELRERLGQSAAGWGRG